MYIRAGDVRLPTHHAREATDMREDGVGRSMVPQGLAKARGPVLSHLKAAEITPAMAEVPLRRARGLAFSA